MGVATFFHSSMPGFTTLRPLWAQRVPDRYLVVRAEWDNAPIYFHNVYAPVEAELRAAFFAALPREFESNSRHIVGGDLNFPMDATLDTTSYHTRHNAGKAECCEWLSSLHVVDAWRTKEPDTKVLSGPRGRTRLDYIFVDVELTAYFHQRSTFDRNAFHGDHMTHSTVLAVSASTSYHSPKHRLWRLPRELLRDPLIVRAIQLEAQTLLDELIAESTCNVGAKWSGWLRRMKTRLRQCHHNHLQLRHESLRILQVRRDAVRSSFARGLVSGQAVEAAEELYKSSCAEWQQHALDTGFDRHASQNEVASSHFLRKSPALKIPIRSAAAGSTVTSDPAEVSCIFTEFWKGIMVKPQDQPPPDPHQYDAVLNHITKALSAEQQADLDRPLEASELASALKTMKRGKSPGPDGWPVEFFLVAPNTFAEILVRVFNYQLCTHGRLLLQQRRSAVTLLYKKGDRTTPSNYRPITLMPVEVKILSRTLAYRLANHANTLVHPSQAGFVKGRNMRDHIYLIQALQHRATRNNEEHYATFLDFAKAYDRVDHTFLFDALRRMNIGPSFLLWIRLLYTKPKVHLLLYNALGPAIQPNRGTKQGCPLSCLLFNLYLEPLGDMLRASPDLGIPLPDGSKLTSVFFADDTTVLSNSLESAEYQIDHIVGSFCAVSGAALNLDKCTTLVLNNAEPPQLRPWTPSLTLSPPGQPIRYLGAFVGHSLPADYHARLINDKFLSSFTRWKCRARTLKGRRIIASSLILSQIWHVTAVTAVPDSMVVVWQRLINNYTLGGRTSDDPQYRPLIHRMWQHDKLLGLGIPHIASSIRTQRLLLLQKLMQPPVGGVMPPWVQLVREQFGHSVRELHRPAQPFDFLWQSPHHLSAWIDLDELQPLWRDVWSAWANTPLTRRAPLPLDLSTTLALPLWDTTFPMFLADDGKNAARMASKNHATRQWCLHGARSGIHSVYDVLRLGVGGSWPTFDRFCTHMSSGNPLVPVVLRAGQIRFAKTLGARRIFDHFTRVFHSVCCHFALRPELPCLEQPDQRHAFRATINDSSVPFERWPRKCVVKMAYHALLPSRDHPTLSPSRPDYAAAKSYLRLVRRLFVVLTPVHADVWIRILFRMVPVNSRFSYRQAGDPNAILCAHRCNTVETIEHAFHSCPRISVLWQTHRLAWQSTGVSFGWFSIINIDAFVVSPAWSAQRSELRQLWAMITGVCLHLVWKQHNLVQYQQRQLPPAAALVDLSFVTWMSTARSWLRRLDPSDGSRDAMLSALDRLLRQPAYQPLRAKYPRCLDLHPSFDVH